MKMVSYRQKLDAQVGNIMKIESNNFMAPEMKAQMLELQKDYLVELINARIEYYTKVSEGEIAPIRSDEIRVEVKDHVGNTFTRDWKATADRLDAIRWTIGSGDLPHTLSGAIVSIIIIPGEESN
jgi:hypothetical protein